MKTLQWILVGVLLLGMSAGVGFFGAGLWSNRGPDSADERGRSPEGVREAPERIVAGRESAPSPAPAERLDHPRWSEINDEGIARLEAGDLEQAVELFERCLEGLPDSQVIRRNLAEALARTAVRDHAELRPCEHCLELLERALELSGGREDLAELAERWRREAEAEQDFWRESSQHFDLAYDGSRDEILHGSHRILEELERGYGELRDFFGEHPVEVGGARISVVLYRRETFGELTGLGDWAGGAFDGVVRVPVEDLDGEGRKLRRILRHELVHAFVRHIGGKDVPGWLNEGLAQWLEPEGRTDVAGARRRLQGAELFELGRLTGSLAQWKDEGDIQVAYAQSLALVALIEHDYGEQVLRRMVAAGAEGSTAEETFRSLTRLELDVVLEDLRRSL